MSSATSINLRKLAYRYSPNAAYLRGCENIGGRVAYASGSVWQQENIGGRVAYACRSVWQQGRIGGRLLTRAVLTVAVVCAGGLVMPVLCTAQGVAATAVTAEDTGHKLRVCADPNNLPFSNQQQQGFENKLAEMVARDLDKTVTYAWFPQRSKFFRKTLEANACDVVMGVPEHIEAASATVPYYRSTYVFVSRRDRNLRISSFDDPRLKDLRIGVHSIGDNDANLPPATALAHRGLASNVVGYSIYGNLAEPNPPGDLVKAVADKSVDVAVVWGPLGGYFAKQIAVPLDLTPVCMPTPDAGLQFTFDIAMGVRRGDAELQRKLNAEIERHRPEIHKLLTSYGVPDLRPDSAPTSESETRSTECH